MGKATGFLENTRRLPEKETVIERLKHSREFLRSYNPAELNQQSGRCMDCGVPFCHNGCPLGNNIPDFNDAVYRGQFEEAYLILSSTNNFPEFTGRICPAPCESACVLGINQPPVAIEEIERHIIEIAFERGYVKPRIPVTTTSKKVAIVGSGPAGLAAAAQLNSVGHQVTVFERDEKPGGLLRYGIPDFKLEKSVLDRRITLMKEEGIVFRCDANVGENVPVNDLLREFQAIVLAGGSTIPRDLLIPGRELNGVYFAMDFLKQQNQRVSDRPVNGEQIIATGKNVVVIGGGDTGSDCVGTANRQGASLVTQLELLPLPPKERTSTMPWPTHPFILKTTTSHEEGCKRQWAVLTKKFSGDNHGNLKALQVVDIQWVEAKEDRPMSFIEIAGTEREIPCELVLLAMGFLHPQKTGMIEQLGVETTGVGNVRAPESTYQTTIPKIFCAGDMRRGQSLVVWAISEGRECARKVDEFLMGSSMLESKDAALTANLGSR